MENLIALVQRACTALGDHGEESALPALWDALPSITVVGGQEQPRSVAQDVENMVRSYVVHIMCICIRRCKNCRNIHAPLISKEDPEERARKFEFVQGLLLSTFLDDNF